MLLVVEPELFLGDERSKILVIKRQLRKRVKIGGPHNQPFLCKAMMPSAM
jgi:hypothetical protein